MRLAIFSDIHGNCVGFDAVLEDFRRREIEHSICLGDALQGGIQPKQVLERLDELGCPVILGNSDDFLVTEQSEGEQVTDALVEVKRWTVEQIGDAGIERIKTFLPTYEIDLGEHGSMLCFHGGPRNHSHVMLPESEDTEFEEVLGDVPHPWLTGGHTHIQYLREISGGRTFFNPGSVGAAYNRNMEIEEFYIYPVAQYAVVTSTRSGVTIEFCQVPFDVDLIAEAAEKSGGPYSQNEPTRYRPR